MKLWYQSLTRESAWPAYNKALAGILDAAKAPDTTIHIQGIRNRGGIGDQYRYLEFIETIEVLENARQAEKDGFDAFLIGNIADPGLRQAREAVMIPVVGLCETSVHTACQLGASFGVVTSNDKHRATIEENLARYRIDRRLSGIRLMNVERLVDLDRGFADKAAGDDLLSRFRIAADALVDDGAEVIIAGVGVVAALLAVNGVHNLAKGAVVLNGIVALLKLAEMIVQMERIAGQRLTSRRAAYGRPPAAQLAELRAAYGDIY
jgi:Asp/Glu/hydantoin racemase